MNDISFLKNIVKKAEKISKKVFEIKQKDGESDLVTNLDLEIEKLLISEIKKKYPSFNIVSEEFNNNSCVTDNCFIIDPIDGTINFANKLPLWGIQIACVKNGKTVASIISLPRIKEVYYADENGAYMNGKKISISEVSKSNAIYAIDGNNILPSIKRMRKYSSNRRNFGACCVSMAFMASGRIQGAVFRSDKPWDYEPGLFICKMAGASICSKNGFHAAAMNKEFLDILELETSKKVDISNIFVLHSLNGDTIETWGLDVKEYFSEKEIDVFLPKFPIRENSSYDSFKEIMQIYINNGQLNENSIVICHSIGNAYFVRFSEEFNYIPKAYIAVAPGAVYEYSSTRNDYIVEIKKQAYVKKEMLEFVKNNLKNKYCIYSDEADKNIEKFTRFIEDIGAESIYLNGYDHFDMYHRIYKIPKLIKLVDSLL